jgi:hypothetical protein
MIRTPDNFVSPNANGNPPMSRPAIWWSICKTVLKFYGLLWMTAVGGFLGANLSAIIGTLFFISENKDIDVQPWSHAGWYIGVAVSFAGGISGKLRFINGTALGENPKQSANNSAEAESDETTVSTVAPSNEDSGVPGFILACGLAGGFIGLLLGGSLLVFPMSYAYSPFANSEAVSSVKVVEEQSGPSSVRRPVVQNRHPVALYLCVTPAVLGVIAGAVGGGLVAVRYRDRNSSCPLQDSKESLIS